MAEIKVLLDAYGVIYEANKVLPSADFKIKFLEALAELEDNQAHKKGQFPKTRLHKVIGVKQTVYRADIDKISGWRLHVQYVDKQLHLIDIIDGQLHDDVIRVIKSKKDRYL
ncbi:MAG: hypothetical protein V5804_17505 [Mucilaginibacter sp.]|uniref:hypothetical protein n=1 Tax=Mucilaginibacter sp. TaxID=1882438 RepID=UPI0034E41A57